MAQITDQSPDGPQDVLEDRWVVAGRVLAQVADHFTAVNPEEPLESHSLLVCISAEAYELAGRSVHGDAGTMSREAWAAAPEVPADITRGEFALHLRDAAKRCGFNWSSDDNQPVIPRIPAPRPAPEGSGGPEASGVPHCCGRPMVRDGVQYVCSRCRSFFQPGGGR